MTGPSTDPSAGICGTMSAIVTGRTQSRPRAIWRVVGPVLVAVTAGLLATAVVGAIARTVPGDGFGLGLLGDGLMAAVVLGVLGVSARYVDRRPFSDYGFGLSRRWVLDCIAGAVLGTLLVGGVFAGAYSLGLVTVVEVTSAGDASSFGIWLLLLGVGWLCGAIWEEALFRGLVLTNAAEGLSARGASPRTVLGGAVLLSSIAFGALHGPFSQVPGAASLAGMLTVWTLMGGLFGVSYVLSGELGFPIGLHFAVNYALNNVFFGVDGAGMLTPPAVVRTEVHAPELWHPIGGLPMIVAILAGYALTCGWFAVREGGLAVATDVARWNSTENQASATE